MEKQRIISNLRRDFPEFGKTPSDFAQRPEFVPEPVPSAYDFARFVASRFAHSDSQRVQHAFDRIEDFLRDGNAETREWVCSFLDALQDIASWRSAGSDVFLRFLGPETRRAWNTLEAIRQDLEDCSTLEAEVLMWRLVHHDPAARAGAA